jgi:uncharacterized membrane protein YkoI
MLKQNLFLGLAAAGLFVISPAKLSLAGSLLVPLSHPAVSTLTDQDDQKMRDDDERKDGAEKDQEKHDRKERKEHEETEESVPMNMVPQAVLDAVKKEIPNGSITEAELEAKRGHIMYAFEVKDGELKYEVKIRVDGKFFSKKVDDDKDENEMKAAEKK